VNIINRQDTPRQQCDDIEGAGNLIPPEKVKAETSPDYGARGDARHLSTKNRVLSKSMKTLSPYPWKVVIVFAQWMSPTYCFIQKRKWSEMLRTGNLHKNQLHVQPCCLFLGFTSHLDEFGSTQQDIKVLSLPMAFHEMTQNLFSF